MQNATPAVFAYVRLDAGTKADLGVDAEELGVYVTEGAIEGVDARTLGPGALGIFDQGTRITLTATADKPAGAAVWGGAPVEGELVFAGPFVMDTPEHARQAERDFLSSKMGRLDGVPF